MEKSLALRQSSLALIDFLANLRISNFKHMFGQIISGRTGTAPSANRFFEYEVTGLSQNDETDKMEYPIRSSASTFITVPYSRMNEEMRRITRMGGKIVNIKPLTLSAKAEATAESE